MMCIKFWKQVSNNGAPRFCIESTQLLFLLKKKKSIVNHNASKIIATLIENSEKVVGKRTSEKVKITKERKDGEKGENICGKI